MLLVLDIDIIVRHGYVLTMDDLGTVFTDGAVAISDGRILDVGDDKDIADRYSARRVIDAAGAPVHPGLVETHLHASYQTIRGFMADHVIEDDLFASDGIDRVFYNQVTDEEEYLGCLLSCMEMVRNGTTCFLEAGTVLTPEMLARAAYHVGIRAVIGDACVMDDPLSMAQGNVIREADSDPRSAPALVARAPSNFEEAMEILGGELRRNSNPDALVRGHVAILGLGTASERLILEAKRVADDAGVVLNMHHAYSPADTAADHRRYGKDPLLHFYEIGVLDRNVVLAHVNHITEAECEVLIESGASVAWAPAASMMWGHGGSLRGRHAELWRRGANISLGSDSANWSNDFDLFRQANLALLTARDSHEDRQYLVAEDVLWMATRGGARAAGMGDRIGSLERGKCADLVVHTLNRPEMVPNLDPVRNLIYASRSKSVHTVIINGKVIIDNGSFTTVDEAAELRVINHASRAMLHRMGQRIDRNVVPNRPRPA